MRNVRSWTNLQTLIGEVLPARQLVANLQTFDRAETLFTLARVAADLANTQDGVLGPEARAWTHDLLRQRADSVNPLERAISTAVSKLPKESAIAHAHAIYVLQLLAIVHGAVGAVRPSDGHLAFLMLAINDHIPEWPVSPGTAMTATEDVLSSMFLCSIFNRSDDPMRFIVRIVSIMECAPPTLSGRATWRAIEETAFGTSFKEYADAFLIPLFFSSKTWSTSTPPIIVSQVWERLAPNPSLARRWLTEAAVTIEQAAIDFAARPLPSGLHALPPAFFRTPLVRVGENLICLSPWHVRDHAVLGTWAKLNAACKTLLSTNSNQAFSSAWGIMFERWCAKLAKESAATPHPSERLLLPSRPGAHDEIEDVIFLDGDVVALVSAKASLVPEASVKSADSPDEAVTWLKRFFFEDPTKAKEKNHRGGALYLLDKKVASIRSGAFEARGIPRTATVLPCIVSFDNVGESGVLYKWLEEEADRKQILFRHGGVRPMTIITPEDYEALLALRARGVGVCSLLQEKTEPREKYGALDVFLYSKANKATDLRLPSMARAFDRIVSEALTRMKDVVDTSDKSTTQGTSGA